MQIPNFVLPLQSQSANGALVQLVRIRACHARGQGFESPTHRRLDDSFEGRLFFVLISASNSRRFFLRIVFFCVVAYVSKLPRPTQKNISQRLLLLLNVGHCSLKIGVTRINDIYFQRYPRFGCAVRVPLIFGQVPFIFQRYSASPYGRSSPHYFSKIFRFRLRRSSPLYFSKAFPFRFRTVGGRVPHKTGQKKRLPTGWVSSLYIRRYRLLQRCQALANVLLDASGYVVALLLYELLAYDILIKLNITISD